VPGLAAFEHRSQERSGGPKMLPDARRLFSDDPADTFRVIRLRGVETPARSLALAVMTQAVIDLRRAPRGQTHGKERNLYAQTRAWFLSDDERGPHAFVSICALFDWNPEAVRRHVLGSARAAEEPVRQLRLVRRG
jgi:hypothetical protein